MAINTDDKLIDKVLNFGIADVIVKEDLRRKMKGGRQLRIKLGIDPTGFDLHLGHMVVVHKLREFQELGHQIILLFGNFTGQIGDPSGKSETRPLRTQAELEENAKHYLKQVSKILDVKKVEVRWNAEWLAPLNFSDVVLLASQFTVAQMMERDMFQERVKKDQPISLHEFMYPLMQGYDSVALRADVELGGTDQTFNLLAGRTLQKAYGQEPQNVLMVPLLVGTDGAMKMGKTTGNYIGVDEKPEDIFGKTMSIPDELILTYCELAARMDKEKIADFARRLKSDENPRNVKMDLAYAIVKLYHGEEAAKAASANFVNIFQNKNLPEKIEETKLKQKVWNLVDLISALKMADSKSKARQLVQGGGVKVDGKKILTIETKIVIKGGKGILIQVGKLRFVRIK